MRFTALSRKEHRGSALKSDNADFAVAPASELWSASIRCLAVCITSTRCNQHLRDSNLCVTHQYR